MMRMNKAMGFDDWLSNNEDDNDDDDGNYDYSDNEDDDYRAHLGWMFEPEDSATESQEKPSEAGFYAIILNKVIDEVRFNQIQFNSI